MKREQGWQLEDPGLNLDFSYQPGDLAGPLNFLASSFLIPLKAAIIPIRRLILMGFIACVDHCGWRQPPGVLCGRTRSLIAYSAGGVWPRLVMSTAGEGGQWGYVPLCCCQLCVNVSCEVQMC